MRGGGYTGGGAWSSDGGYLRGACGGSDGRERVEGSLLRVGRGLRVAYWEKVGWVGGDGWWTGWVGTYWGRGSGEGGGTCGANGSWGCCRKWGCWEGRVVMLPGGVDDGIGPDDLQAPEVAAIHELGVQHALDVVHPLGGLCHVQTHGEGVKVVVHVPENGGRHEQTTGTVYSLNGITSWEQSWQPLFKLCVRRIHCLARHRHGAKQSKALSKGQCLVL